MIKDIQSIISLTKEEVDFDPNHWQIFYKVLLEFDLRNLIHILAFDQNSMEKLLSEEDNKAEFSKMDKYPIFFLDNENRSAIDNALDANQLGSVALMIEYVVRHQNRFEFNCLFSHNLVELLEKATKVSTLLNSELFNYHFTFDDWENQHADPRTVVMPFNGNPMKLRQLYEETFKGKIDYDAP